MQKRDEKVCILSFSMSRRELSKRVGRYEKYAERRLRAKAYALLGEVETSEIRAIQAENVSKRRHHFTRCVMCAYSTARADRREFTPPPREGNADEHFLMRKRLWDRIYKERGTDQISIIRIEKVS